VVAGEVLAAVAEAEAGGSRPRIRGEGGLVGPDRARL